LLPYWANGTGGPQNFRPNNATIALSKRGFGMRRIWIINLGIILVLAAGIGIFLAADNSHNHNSAKKTTKQIAASQPAAKPKAKSACSIFTLADAKQVLGDTAKGGSVNDENSSDDLTVSSCSYTQDSGANVPVSSGKTAGLLVRAPKTGSGDTQDVSGYGDSAYWDPQLGQLNILKNNTWYILSNGPVTPASRTLDQAKQLADLLISKM
jgi:hypothetical protein